MLNHFLKEEHGGGCCGITHIHTFPTYNEYSNGRERKYYTNEQLEELFISSIDSIIGEFHEENDYWDDVDSSSSDRLEDGAHLIEVVLNEHQARWDDYFWMKVLKHRGFTLVNTFVNTNSDNCCYVFHLIVGNNNNTNTRIVKQWEALGKEKL